MHTRVRYEFTQGHWNPTDQNPLVSRSGGPGPSAGGLPACLRAAVSGEESQAKGPGCFSPSGPHAFGDGWFFFIVKLWTFKTC